VLLDFFRIDAPAAGHAKVEHQGVVPIGIDEPVLRPPAKPGHQRPSQTLAEVDRQSSPEIRSPGLDARDSAPPQHPLKSANGGLDFRKLRHDPHDMADVV